MVGFETALLPVLLSLEGGVAWRGGVPEATCFLESRGWSDTGEGTDVPMRMQHNGVLLSLGHSVRALKRYTHQAELIRADDTFAVRYKDKDVKKEVQKQAGG